MSTLIPENLQNRRKEGEGDKAELGFVDNPYHFLDLYFVKELVQGKHITKSRNTEEKIE